jgi:hypothetical protein
MNFEQQIISSINHQFRYNDQKNLFYFGREDIIKLAPETINFIDSNRNELIAYFENGNLTKIINYLTDKVIELFFRSNQYLNFNSGEKNNLRNIYNIYLYELFHCLKNNLSIEAVVHSHFDRLVGWLKNTNPFIEAINSPDMPAIPEIVCAEYSKELQMNVLSIDVNNIMEPILDIGCGESGTIVTFLRSLKKEAFGIDRLIPPNESYFTKSDWFEYELKSDYWGTIICNMSFTNHFVSHHLRSDCDAYLYAEKYMEILNAIKTGGKFHYAPGLPFIETYLPHDKFRVDNRFIDGNIKISRTVIEKLK